MAAGKATTLTVRIVSDAAGAGKGFDAAGGKVAAFEKKLDRASGVAAGVLGGLAAIGKEAFDAASALQQSTGAVESVFAKQSEAVKALAADAAQSVGLSANQYQELAAVMGAQLGNMGVAADQLAPKTDELIRLGADMAATYGGTTADAVAALSSMMRGETDPIEKYGVSIKQADIAARMAADGTLHLEGAQGKAAKTQAMMALLAEQTGAATGAFAREADTAAGQTQRAAAAFEDAKAKLGNVLLPVVTLAMDKLSGLASMVQRNSDAVLVGVAVFAGLAATVLVVNAAIKVTRATLVAYKAIIVAVRTAQLLWNLALLANPLGAVVVAIMAVIGVAVLLYKKFPPIRAAVAAMGAYFRTGFAIAKAAIEPLISALSWVWEKIRSIGSWFADAGGWVSGLFGGGGTVTMTHTGGPALLGGGGMMGAPMMGATSTSTGGGPVPAAAGRGTTYVNITVEGALDPVAVGRQIDALVRQYATTVGRSPLVLGAAR